MKIKSNQKGGGEIVVFIALGIMLLVWLMFTGVTSIISKNHQEAVQARNEKIQKFFANSQTKPKSDNIHRQQKGYSLSY